GRPVDWGDPATSEAVLGPLTRELKLFDAMAGWLRGPDSAGPAQHEAPRLGGVTIEREIGSGGSGVVYLARDDRLQRSVALKVLPGDVALDAERLAHVEREARMLASLNHPNIATIYGMAVDARG